MKHGTPPACANGASRPSRSPARAFWRDRRTRGSCRLRRGRLGVAPRGVGGERCMQQCDARPARKALTCVARNACAEMRTHRSTKLQSRPVRAPSAQAPRHLRLVPAAHVAPMPASALAPPASGAPWAQPTPTPVAPLAALLGGLGHARGHVENKGGVARLAHDRGHCIAFWPSVPPLQVAPSFACSVASLSRCPGH